MGLLMFCAPIALGEATVPAGLSYPAEEFILAAADLHLYVPTDMDSYGGDMASYDLGSRLNIFTDTFSMDIDVKDARDMLPADYAAFYAKRTGYAAVAPEIINDLTVYHLTDNADSPAGFAFIVSDYLMDAPEVVYVLTFTAQGAQDVALSKEILSTLSPME